MAQYMVDALLGYISDHISYHVMDLAFQHGHHTQSNNFILATFWDKAVQKLDWSEIFTEWKMELFHQIYREVQPEDLTHGLGIFWQVRSSLGRRFRTSNQILCLDSLDDLKVTWMAPHSCVTSASGTPSK